MASRIIIPRMGQTMTDGVVAKWYVKDGQSVQPGDNVYELEYDKATASIPAKQAGIIRLLVQEGDTVPLGEAVAVVLGPGETLEDVNTSSAHAVANAAKGGATVTAAVQTRAVVPDSASHTEAMPGATPLVKRLAREMGIDLGAIIPADGKRITKEDLERYAAAQGAETKPEISATGDVYAASPMAKKMAAENGIDFSLIVPADGRRITREDVIRYAETKTNWQTDPSAIKKESADSSEKREPLKGMRKVIAQRMTESYFRYPVVTLTTDADMQELLKLRLQLNEEYEKLGIKLTVTDMLIKAVAKALRDNPVINTSLDGDTIIYHSDVNVGVAVALQNGLVVPVIKQADQCKLDEISVELKRLSGLAHSGGLSTDDMEGGTFTVTNLGTEGIDCFTPIINIPESAILGVGRTVEKPVVLDGRIVIRPKAVLSITHDHRVIDGVPAAKFLQSVARYIEKPFLLLMD